MARRSRKVVRYRKPIHINIGIVVFIIIFVYMVIITLNYFRSERISNYLVTEKSISDDDTYEGIIIRDETVYNTQKAGYVNYYVNDGGKTAKNAAVYTIDETGELYKLLMNSENQTNLSKEDTLKIRNSIASFRKEYHGSNFISVEDFKYDIDNIILEQGSSNLLSDYKKLSKAERKNFELVKTKKSGIISYTVDGMEGLTSETITQENFQDKITERTQLRTNEIVPVGSPVYKLVNSEDWNIILSLDKEQYDKLKGLETVKVRTKKENITMDAAISCYESNQNYFANLSLNQYMIRFLNERYIDIELLLNSAKGFKIPVTSILKTDFLLVANEFVQNGGSSNNPGVTKVTTNEKGDTVFEFINVTVVSKDEENTYIQTDYLKADDIIQNTENQKQVTLGKKGTLEGVYNVNKGFAVFRVIEKIYENKEYVIVSKDTPYGLSAYDHIVVNADSIKNSELIKK